MRRRSSALLLLLAAWPAAANEQPREPRISVALPAVADFRMPRASFPIAPGPVRNGIVGALPIAPNLELAVGRFTVLDPPRPRTHMESERSSEVRRRDRGIAAVGLSFRF